jgi:copper transport protein
LASAPAALAHANLARSDPPANADLETAPGQVQLWFTERPELRLSDVQVFDGQRRRVDRQAVAVGPGDPAESLAQALQPGLPQGVYTVSWKVTSAEDGHVTAGAYAFGIGLAPTGTEASAQAAASAPAPGPFTMIVRWLSYLGVAGLVGTTLFPMLVLQPALESMPSGLTSARQLAAVACRRCNLAGWTFGVIAIIGALDTLLDQAFRSSGEVSVSTLALLISTPRGALLVARGVVAGLMFALLFTGPALFPRWLAPPQRSLGAAATSDYRSQPTLADLFPWMLGVLSLLELALFAFTSHALGVASAPDLAVFVDWVHITLASVWVGGLLGLVLAVLPATGSTLRTAAALLPGDVDCNRFFGPVLGQFSRLGLLAAGGLAITGFYQALAHVGSLDNLLPTDYGQALMVKTIIFAAVLLLAAFHRYIVLPHLTEPRKAAATRGRRLLGRSLPVEAVLGIGILAATGVLTSFAPANSQDVAGVSISKDAGDLKLRMQVQPLTIGPNEFRMTVQSKGKVVDNADKVELTATMLDMDMGQTVIELENAGQGTYSAQSEALAMGGRWRLDALVRVPGEFDQRASFEVNVK